MQIIRCVSVCVSVFKGLNTCFLLLLLFLFHSQARTLLPHADTALSNFVVPCPRILLCHSLIASTKRNKFSGKCTIEAAEKGQHGSHLGLLFGATHLHSQQPWTESQCTAIVAVSWWAAGEKAKGNEQYITCDTHDVCRDWRYIIRCRWLSLPGKFCHFHSHG